jgi:hypothetical protein
MMFSPTSKLLPPKTASFVAAAASLLFSFCAITPAAHAYVLLGQKWAPGVVVMQLELGSPAAPLSDGNTSWNAAVAPALETWNGIVDRVKFAPVMNSTLPTSARDGVNSITFSNTVYGQSFGTYTLAVSYRLWNSSSAMTETDILFNKAQKFDSYRGPLKFMSNGQCLNDIRRVLVHELGHSLGLNHPDSAGQDVDAIMNSVESDRETPSADDVAGAQKLYGAAVVLPTPTPTPVPTPTPSPIAAPSHLANISTRMRVGTADNALIGGFIVQGSESKKVILRAIGPSLTAGGIAGAMADPKLELHDSSGQVLAQNDNWQQSAQANEIIATMIAPASFYESAIVATLPPGSYTAVVSAANGGAGVALVELYELDKNATRLVNISTRGRVGLADEALIGGLIVLGDSPKKMMLRALGPSLAAGGINGALPNPRLEIRDAAGNLLFSNDDWSTSSQHDQIVATGVAPSSANEPAIVATLEPGNYTAVVQGVNGSTGVGLVEVFDLDR